MKTYQISEELFLNLCDYFLDGCQDQGTYNEIKKEISAKYNAIMRRMLFSAYKDSHRGSLTRESARQQYLNYASIPDSFRSTAELDEDPFSH